MDRQSFWLSTAEKPEFNSEHKENRYDVIVVGGGLTGITTALLLARAGVKTIVLEANEVGSGTSGHTTAKITAQHDVRLSKLSDNKASIYYNANDAGLHFIRSLIKELNIDCDFETQSAFVYALTEKEERDVKKEKETYDRLGIEAQLVHHTELPFHIRCALELKNQAQFHPIKYLYALAKRANELGVPILEKTKAIAIERGDHDLTVQTEDESLTADALVLATGYPMFEFPGIYFLRLHQRRSYLMAVQQQGPCGMYINSGSPARSVRSHKLGEEPWLLVGGFGHRTAKEDKKDTGYEPLDAFLHSTYPGADVVYGWSAQDGRTLDRIPYVGGVYENGPQIYIAAGYDKWGMTNSAAASLMITDEITEKHDIDDEIKSVFNPRRFSPIASAGGFIKQAGEAVYEFTGGNIAMPVGSLDDVYPGEGAVLRIDGQATAVYKDENGHAVTFKAHCTHLGCPLEYNEEEHTFDCPCHGSRFSMTGEVIENPALLPLKRTDEE